MKSDSSARRFGAALLVAVVALSVAAVGIGPGGFAGTAAAADATEGSFTAGPQVAQSSPDGADDLVVNDVTADGEATLVVTYFDGDNNRILAGTTQVNSPSGADVQVDTQSATLGFRYKVFLMPRSEANSYVGGTSQGGTLSGAPTRDQFVALGTVQFVETSYSSFSDTDAEAESYTFSDAPPVSSVPIAATSEFTFDDGGGTFADEFSLSVSTRKLNPGETASSGAVIATSPLYDDRYPTRETTFEADLSGHLSQGDNTLYVNLHRGDGFSAPVVQKGATSTFSEPITVTLKRIDVQVTDLQTNAPVTEGEDLTVEATFTNEGNLDLIQYEDSVSATFGVDPSGGSSYATQQTLTLPDDLSETYGISAGESVSYTFTYSTSTGEAPNVGVRVTTDDDPDGVSKTATVEELTPDLQVTSVSPQDSGVAAGETLDVQATLDNQGNAQADGQTVTLEVDSNGDGSYTQVDSQTVTVADGATKDVTLSYNSQESDGSSVDVRVTTEDDTTGQTATASLAVPDSITGASVSFAGSGLDPEETATFTATVENTNGNAFQGLDVTFDTTGDGTLTAVQATSDSDGTVIAEYTPAVSDAGETVEVQAEGEYLFTATVSRGGEIQVSRGSAIAEELERAIDRSQQIVVSPS